MQIDVYYDVTCSLCGRSRSTDFYFGMAESRQLLRKQAKKEGWGTAKDGCAICPACMPRAKEATP